MGFLFPFLDGKRSLEDHHGGEAVALAGFLRVQRFVTAHGKGFLQTPAEGSYHVVVEVPSLHAEGFPGIESGEGIRGLERGNGEQSFVHDGNGISHRFPLCFAHGDSEVL